MASRGKIPYEGRTIAPGMMRHGPVSSSSSGQRLEPLPPPELLEDKIAVQAAEIKQLAEEKHRLAATQISLREDLIGAQEEIPRLKAHIRSIQTESDIQIRVLLGKIAKSENDIRSGESVKKELQKVHIEAQSLVKDRQELAERIRDASKELQKARLDVKSLPALRGDLDSLRQEHQRLHATFEHEKTANTEKAEQLREREKTLIGMAREYEKLRVEVLNAETRAQAPTHSYDGGYVNPSISYQPPLQGGGFYVDSYGTPLMQTGFVPVANTTMAYGGENMVVAAPTSGVSATAVSGIPDGVVWGGPYPYDPSLAPR